jgi:hypothetical protein
VDLGNNINSQSCPKSGTEEDKSAAKDSVVLTYEDAKAIDELVTRNFGPEREVAERAFKESCLIHTLVIR